MKLRHNSNNDHFTVTISAQNAQEDIVFLVESLLEKLKGEPRLGNQMHIYYWGNDSFIISFDIHDHIQTELDFLWTLYELAIAHKFVIEINDGTLASATIDLSHKYLHDLVEIRLITSLELNNASNLAVKPSYVLADSLLSSEPNSTEATKLHQLIILLGNASLTANQDESLKTKRMAEWLFAAYMRTISHPSFLSMPRVHKLIRKISQMLTPKEDSPLSLQEQENLFNIDNISNAIFDYYQVCIKLWGYHEAKLHLNNPECSNINDLFMTALYKKNDITLLTSLLDEKCITIEYKVGEEKTTLLQFAFIMNNPEIACELLSRGANLFALSDELHSVIFYLMRNARGTVNDPKFFYDIKQLTDIIFSQSAITPKKILQLCSDIYSYQPLPPKILQQYTLSNLKKFVLNPEKFLLKLLSDPNNRLLLKAMWQLYDATFSLGARALLFTLTINPTINHQALLALMKFYPDNVFHNVISPLWLKIHNTSNVPTIMNYFDRIIHQNLRFAFSVLQNYRYAKHDLIKESAFVSFLEIRISEKASENQAGSNYSLTYVLAKCSLSELENFIHAAKLPVDFVRSEEGLCLIRIKMPLNNLIKYLKLYQTPPQVPYTPKNKDDARHALQVITKPALSFISSYAARRVEQAVGNDFKLMDYSKRIPNELQIKLNANIPLVAKAVAANMKFIPTNREIQASEIEYALKNLVSEMRKIDFDLMHASKHPKAVIDSGFIFSNRDLAEKIISHDGGTSAYDKMFGNDKYVYFVMNTPNKPFPEKLDTFYGNTVFVLSLTKLLERGYQLWLKTSDWYGYPIRKVKTHTIGNTTIEYSHHIDDGLSSCYMIVKYKIGGNLQEKRIKMVNESFINGDIITGLASVLIDHIKYLDPETQYSLLSPFLREYTEFVRQQHPSMCPIEAENTAHELQQQSISQLHELIPACELSIANRVNLTTDVIKRIEYIDHSVADTQPAITFYTAINKIYVSIAKKQRAEKIVKLINKNQHIINIPHALFDITLLTKSMIHKAYPVMESLLTSASVLQLSRLRKDSGHFTHLMNSILLNDMNAMNILLSSHTDPNQVIYVDNNGNSASQPSRLWDQPITASFIAKLFCSSPEFEQKLENARLPERNLLVFAPRASIDSCNKILLARKGYKKGQDLLSHGDWVLPAVLVDNINDLQLHQFTKNLTYLLDVDFDDSIPVSFTINSTMKLDCIDCTYNVLVMDVDLSNYHHHIPSHSAHLAQIRWCDQTEIGEKLLDDIPIKESNTMLLNPSASPSIVCEKWQLDLNGPYALHQAIIKNDLESIKQLLSQNVYSNCKVCVLHPETKAWLPGSSPLITATLYSKSAHYSELLNLLLNYGADIFIENKLGKTVLDYASPLFLQALRECLIQNNKSHYEQLFSTPKSAVDDNNNNNRKRHEGKDEEEDELEIVEFKRIKM
ncbi:MAG: hypothetical protein H0U71_06620 [Gammaproteobacteria bacterium]|nr:hypothetical protein [Gammaproteobacteria bacterium]